MKSKTFLIQLLFLTILSVIDSDKLKSSSRIMSHALFSVNNSNLQISGPGDANFKGKVVLDNKGRGVIISSAEDSHSESFLRLVSEKLDNDSYLVDYRLMRSCDFDLRFTNEEKTNLSVHFSPQSVENRNKNDHFDLLVEIYDPKLFLPNSMKSNSEKSIKSYLKSQCEARKASISATKVNFATAIEKFRGAFRELAELNKKLKIKEKEVETVKATIADTVNQIQDINYLQANYDRQLKSINSLTSGSRKLITTETEKKKELAKKLKETEAKIVETEKKIKETKEELAKKKENYTQNLEKSKEPEGLIINYQKDLSELENQISNSKSFKLRLDLDLKYSNDEKKKNDNSLTEIMKQTEKLTKKQNELVERIDTMLNEKNKMEHDIFKEKEEIKQIEQAINDLILKKSKKEESLKKRYDDVKAKEENITTLKIEKENFISQIKKLGEQKDQIENVKNTETVMKIKSISQQIQVSEKEAKLLTEKVQKVNENLKDQDQKKETISSSIGKISDRIALIRKNIVDLQKEKSSLDKTKADIVYEIRNKEEKVDNLEKDSTNYRAEVENIKKSLNSAQDNINTFNSILSDFKSKLAPIETKYKEYLSRKSIIVAQVKASKTQIKEASSKMKNEVKPAMVMIDLAEDEAFNIDEESALSSTSEDKKKYRNLIDQIIS